MYQQLIDEIGAQIKELEEIRAASEKLPELAKAYQVIPSTQTKSILISSPFDPALIKEHEAAFAAAGWTFLEEFDSPDSGDLRRQWMIADGVRVEIFYHPNIRGATCKRKLIGHDKRPIYERVCSAGAPT